MLEFSGKELLSHDAYTQLAVAGCDDALIKAVRGAMRYLAVFSCPDAPSVHCAAGVTHDGQSVGGASSSGHVAILKMMAEFGEVQAYCRARALGAASLPCRRLSDGGPVDAHAADLFPPEDGDHQQSSGLAAHPDTDEAVKHGAFELLERREVARWWDGGAPGRPLRLDLEAALGARIIDRSTRPPTLIALSEETWPPVVACVSFDPDDGRFACGTAAAEDWRKAVCKAFDEMAQVEAGQWMLREKLRLHGHGAINKADEAELKRAGGIREPSFMAGAVAGDPINGDAPREMGDIRDRLSFAAPDAYWTDLGCEAPNLRVVKVVAPSFGTPRKSVASQLAGAGGAALW